MCRLIMFILLFVPYLSVYAVDVTIHLSGGILAQSCNVSSQDLTKNINFPDLNPSDFNKIGATSAEQAVTIRLQNCTGRVNNMTYQFSGEADTIDPTLLKTLGKGDAPEETLATGLAIEILDQSKKKIALNTIQSINEMITTANYNLNFYFRYKSTSNNIGSGDASSIAYLDIYYE